ncbi:hypothetical protein [Metamycoplasma hominis]|uniref:hypothetical protein n=1 Tax=Metamycoplasma hominis TaxID=2098 RepID=UPI003CEF3F4D
MPSLFADIANKSKNIAYLISLGLNKCYIHSLSLFSLVILISYLINKKFKVNTIYKLIFRIISSSIIIIVLTLINNFTNYFVTFVLYSLLILIGLFANKKLI